MRTIHIVVDSPIHADVETVRKAAEEAGLSVEVSGQTTDPKRARLSLGPVKLMAGASDRASHLRQQHPESISCGIEDGVGTKDNGAYYAGGIAVSVIFPTSIAPEGIAHLPPDTYRVPTRWNDTPLQCGQLTEAVGIPYEIARAVYAADGALSIGEALQTASPGWNLYDEGTWRRQHDPAAGYDPDNWQAVHGSKKTRAELIRAVIDPIFRWAKTAVGAQGTVDPTEVLST